jgi:hypothetical protein
MNSYASTPTEKAYLEQATLYLQSQIDLANVETRLAKRVADSTYAIINIIN